MNSKKWAKEISVAKYQWIVNNGGIYAGVLEAIPELDSLLNKCAYCELYKDRETNSCEKCPVSDYNFEGCRSHNHPYSIWAREQTKESAQDMLNLIESI